MTAKSTALLYSDLGIAPSFSRPRISYDNPYSEAAFKTLMWESRGGHGHHWSLDAPTMHSHYSHVDAGEKAAAVGKVIALVINKPPVVAARRGQQRGQEQLQQKETSATA